MREICITLRFDFASARSRPWPPSVVPPSESLKRFGLSMELSAASASCIMSPMPLMLLWALLGMPSLAAKLRAAVVNES